MWIHLWRCAKQQTWNVIFRISSAARETFCPTLQLFTESTWEIPNLCCVMLTSFASSTWWVAWLGVGEETWPSPDTERLLLDTGSKETFFEKERRDYKCMQTGGRRKKRRGKRKWRKLIKKTEKKNTENKNGNKWRKINEWAEEEKWKYKEKERTKVKKQENYENRLKKKIKNLCERKFVKTKLKIKKVG